MQATAASRLADTLRLRLPLVHVVNNPANYALFTLAGSVASGALLGRPPQVSAETLLWFITALGLAVDALSFLFAAGARAVYSGVSVRRSFTARVRAGHAVPDHLGGVHRRGRHRLDHRGPGGARRAHADGRRVGGGSSARSRAARRASGRSPSWRSNARGSSASA